MNFAVKSTSISGVNAYNNVSNTTFGNASFGNFSSSVTSYNNISNTAAYSNGESFIEPDYNVSPETSSIGDEIRSFFWKTMFKSGVWTVSSTYFKESLKSFVGSVVSDSSSPTVGLVCSVAMGGLKVITDGLAGVDPVSGASSMNFDSILESFTAGFVKDLSNTRIFKPLNQLIIKTAAPEEISKLLLDKNFNLSRNSLIKILSLSDEGLAGMSKIGTGFSLALGHIAGAVGVDFFASSFASLSKNILGDMLKNENFSYTFSGIANSFESLNLTFKDLVNSAELGTNLLSSTWKIIGTTIGSAIPIPGAKVTCTAVGHAIGSLASTLLDDNQLACGITGAVTLSAAVVGGALAIAGVIAAPVTVVVGAAALIGTFVCVGAYHLFFKQRE